MSDQETWYIDHLNVPWDKFYMIEPHLGITDATKQDLVICGKVYIWG
jgi:hexosaminidase